MRQRVQANTSKASTDGKVNKDEGNVAVEEDDFDNLNPVLRVCWQYGVHALTRTIPVSLLTEPHLQQRRPQSRSDAIALTLRAARR
ncbi:hypothetical protein WJX73_003283 [Symbiochloris irregularis]|uniref:Uncharacterized protein n=1 Tax=Symbiochloris irregularis TaxID=706552 RepID=A0AAW1NZ86_9CHLO